ncbi:rasGAP-activating-like protein 1-like [Scleropages formosus]|uniref:RasGAP-activating-like protein 1-like n=1 Tax=Scleropages formosus TaxID=113540 RepID=A0A0P7UJS5_SCLFO|nr:rasGAP-activating-like protein 1-like [Scleropages formosus]
MIVILTARRSLYCLDEALTAVSSCRTATVWKNLNPFWGEEFTLHLPMGFHTLSFYVMDEDTISHDDVIGKISLSKEAIASQSKGLDSWLNLRRVDPDEEVQGEIHLELELQRDPLRTTLRCHVIEARDLAPRDISGTSDPFARVIFNSRSAETSIIKRTRFPHWDELLEMELEQGEVTEDASLTLEVWDWDMVGRNDFLGKVEIPLRRLWKTPVPQGWFRLMPMGTTEEDAGGKLGALRLKVRLVEERILPSACYQPLIDLLAESVISPAEEDDVSPLTLLEDVTTAESRQDVAMTLVKIYLGQGLVVPFLDYLNTREVNRTSDPNTLFRSNSLASKAMEQFMKAVGMLYLHEVLKPIVNRIFEEKKYIELDPSKIELNRTRRISFKGVVSESEVRDTSVELLQEYLTCIVDSIVGSLARRAAAMATGGPDCALARVSHPGIRAPADRSSGRHECLGKARCSSETIGCAVLLREKVRKVPPHPSIYLSVRRPSIVRGPAHTQRVAASPTRSRTCALLRIAGAGGYSLSAVHSVEVLPQTTVPDARQRAVFLPSVTLKEGFLHKRKADSPQLLTRFAFKKRYFWLSSESLSYAKSPDWQCEKGEATHTCVFDCLSLQNVNELNQWLSAIRKASIDNAAMLSSFHPGAHRSGRWTCCQQTDRTAQGCSRTHSAVTLGDWSDPLDPDAEAQTIYKQLLHGRDELR